jgi:hypothetical protein
MAIPHLNDPFTELQKAVVLPERVVVEASAKSRRGRRA